VQLGAIIGGVGLSVAALGWHAHGDGPAALVLVAGAVICAGFLLFGVQIVGTFRRKSTGTVSALPVVPRPASSTGA
jgi:hypothetical protein